MRVLVQGRVHARLTLVQVDPTGGEDDSGGWRPRTADPAPPSEELPVWMSATLLGVGWGVGFALFGAILVGIDAASVNGVPRERAEVVRVTISETRLGCEGGDANDSPSEVVGFEVAQPRAGFPSTFEIEACPDIYTVGEHVTIARRHGEDEPAVDPPSGWDIPVFAASLGGAVGAGAFLYRLVTGGAVAWVREEKDVRRRRPNLSSEGWLGPTDPT